MIGLNVTSSTDGDAEVSRLLCPARNRIVIVRSVEKIHFSVTINASGEKVWRVLLDDETYRIWTSEFAEGSYVVTDWKEGSKALFLTPDGNGMVSRIAEHVPSRFLSIEHLGIVKEGVEDTESDEVKQWAGARENYLLREGNGVSELSIDVEVNNDEKQTFEEIWPKALARVKELAEG